MIFTPSGCVDSTGPVEVFVASDYNILTELAPP
jgi:hypothetical protein